MKEAIISLETATLAKEKGFYEHCDNFYNRGSNYKLQSDHLVRSGSDDLIVEAPTQSLLQKWLREEHHIYVSVERCTIGSDEWEYGYFIEWLPKENHQDKRRSGSFKEKRSFHESIGTYIGAWYTYEEGLEKGLQEALNLIQ